MVVAGCVSLCFQAAPLAALGWRGIGAENVVGGLVFVGLVVALVVGRRFVREQGRPRPLSWIGIVPVVGVVTLMCLKDRFPVPRPGFEVRQS